MGFSQTFYDRGHTVRHMGNSDRPDENGKTVDPLSVSRHGDHGEPENIWSYVFLRYFRDDPVAIYRDIKRRNAADARWGIIEIAVLSYRGAWRFGGTGDSSPIFCRSITSAIAPRI